MTKGRIGVIIKVEVRNMYVYIESEHNLWTVGFYSPDGKSHHISIGLGVGLIAIDW